MSRRSLCQKRTTAKRTRRNAARRASLNNELTQRAAHEDAAHEDARRRRKHWVDANLRLRLTSVTTRRRALLASRVTTVVNLSIFFCAPLPRHPRAEPPRYPLADCSQLTDVRITVRSCCAAVSGLLITATRSWPVVPSQREPAMERPGELEDTITWGRLARGALGKPIPQRL